MLKKTLTYVDYNGVERTEDFYFNLTKSELTVMELSEYGGFKQRIEKIINTKDSPKLTAIFQQIILDAYGEKSDDGRRFIKNQELRDSFAQTEAYNMLFMELASDANAAAVFINGITPPDVSSEETKE